MVSFDSPARAIRCAFAVHRPRSPTSASRSERDPHRRGRARRREAARDRPARRESIAAHSESGEILVSATTRELAAGAGLVFTDRGEHALEGVSEPRRLYAARRAGDRACPCARAAELRTRPGIADHPPVLTEYPAGLTAREVDVLRLVAIGLSDAEVAERSSSASAPSTRTCAPIYRKLGVRSRAAAGRFAEENGLL